MKKHLLTTTAALAMVGGAASAQEWDVNVGGFFTGNLTFSEAGGSLVGADEDFDGLQTHINTEVHFKPSVTLDNGMTFGAHIELEGNTSSDQIDETYMYVESDRLGRIEFGSENSAGYKSMVGAPGVGGLPINSGSVSAFMPVELGASTQTGADYEDDGIDTTTTNNIELQETAEDVSYASTFGSGTSRPSAFATGEDFTGNLGSLVNGTSTNGNARTVNTIAKGEGVGTSVGSGTAALQSFEDIEVGPANKTEADNGLDLEDVFTAQTDTTLATLWGDTDSGSESASIELNFTNADGDGLVGPTRFRDAFGSSFTETSGNNDANRISYYTPSFNGLTIGVSYAADASEGNALEDRNDNVSDFFDIGANYSQSFGAMDVTLAARYGTADASGSTTVYDLDANGDIQRTAASTSTGVPTNSIATTDVANSDPETWAVGFQLGYDAFTVGASYAENESGLANNAGDSEGYSVGMTYNTGVWTIGGEMYAGEGTMGDLLRTNIGITAAMAGDGDEGLDVSSTTTTTRERVTAEYTAFKIAANRSLGDGVNWAVYAMTAEQKAKAGGATLADVDATAVGTAISLNF